MPRRTILTDRQRSALFDLPVDEPSLRKHYTLADDDLQHIGQRRRDENRLVSSECFSRCRCLHRPLRLLPAGATVAGRGSHPLWNGAFHGAPDRNATAGLLTGRIWAGFNPWQDKARAMKWFRRGAALGFTKAQLNLGDMYALGHSVPKDYVRAYAWLNFAATQGEAEGEMAAKARDELQSSMTAEQIAAVAVPRRPPSRSGAPRVTAPARLLVQDPPQRVAAVRA